MFASATGGVYFAAASGALYHTTDGKQLQTIDLGGNSNSLVGVFGFAAGDVFAVGNAGAIFHGGIGRPFVAEYSDAPTHLAAVWGDGIDDVWAVGAGGEVLHDSPIVGVPDLAFPFDGGVPVDLLPSGDLLACGPVTVAKVAGAAPPDGGAGISQPTALTYDGSRYLYVLNSGGQLVQIDTIGGAIVNQPVNGSTLGTTADLVADGAGNLYAADSEIGQILKLTPSVTGGGGFDSAPFAGAGGGGFVDGAAGVATFNQPNGLALDQAGVLYVADSQNFAVRTVSANGTVATLAGNGTTGSADGAGGRNGVAQFGLLNGIAVDSSTGNVYVVDAVAPSIRRIAPDGTTSTFIPFTTVIGGFAADRVGHLYTELQGLDRSSRSRAAPTRSW